MKKKYSITLIIIILIIIGFIGYTEFSNNNNKESVEIGNINYTLPSGYHEESSDGNNSANITNGTNTLQLSVLSGDNVTNYFLDYESDKAEQNKTVTLNKFNINNTLVYRSDIVNDTSFIHYWFAYNKKVYSISTWDGNNNTDNIVMDLIKTIKSSK